MAEIDPASLKYRQMLIRLDKTITTAELSRMKTFCKDVIGTKNRDQIDSCVVLWERLEERKLLSPTDLNFLKTALTTCTDGRLDVFDIVTDFEKHGNPHIQNGTGSGGQPEFQQPQCSEEMKTATQYLINNLGKDWKFFMRSLDLPDAVLDMCVDSHPRNVREQIHMAFREWQAMGQANKSDLLRALKEIHRNDLHQKLSVM